MPASQSAVFLVSAFLMGYEEESYSSGDCIQIKMNSMIYSSIWRKKRGDPSLPRHTKFAGTPFRFLVAD